MQIEYKLYLCGMSVIAVNKKRGQMWRRIVNGKGRAFYEIGVADDGSNYGI